MSRLGTRARAALRRATEVAMRAGGARPAATEIQRQYDYALQLVETAMIIDRAEAEAAAAAGMQDPHG